MKRVLLLSVLFSAVSVRLGLVLVAMLWATGAAYADGGKPSRFGPNEGEVLQVDRAAQEITIRHGYLPELSMDPMSMVFKVADPAFLERVRKGDRVTFKPGLVEGRFAVMSIERIGARKASKPRARPQSE